MLFVARPDSLMMKKVYDVNLKQKEEEEEERQV